MATLIPSYRSCASRMTSGEKRLAQSLEAKLDDDYLLWYDVPVGPKCLHPDFILLHPLRGLFVLEVKDWKLETIQSVDPRSFEIATPSGVKTVDNPLHLARNYALAMCSLLEKDEALVQAAGRYKGKLICPYAYGVVLPNITRRMFDSQPALAQVLMLAYEFAKEIMQPTDGKDEDVPPMVEPNSAGREGPVPVLVKCASYKAEIAYIIQRAVVLKM